MEVFREGLHHEAERVRRPQRLVRRVLSTPYDGQQIHEIGVGNLMWGTDLPHPEGTWPHTAEKLQEFLGHLPADEIQQIVGLNALDVYSHFDRDTLEAFAQQIGPEMVTTA